MAYKIGVKYGENGVIGWDGTWYPCEFGCHIEVMKANKNNTPFATIHYAEAVFFVSDSFNLGGERYPSRAQFERVMDWCTDHGEIFEEVIMSEGWEYWA